MTKTAVAVSTARPGPDTSSLEWREAFVRGLQRRGWKAEVSTSPKPCDLLVMWGIRRQDFIARQKAEGGEICILERGYMGDRFAWTSASFGGGLNGRGEFRGPHEDASRFDKHFAHLLAPWCRQEGYALIMGQVPGDQSIRGVDIAGWYRQTAIALKKAGHDVAFRPHPKAGRSCIGAEGVRVLRDSLEESLRGASVVVTYNSNSGVDAVLRGRPTVAMDRGSMVWDIAGHQVTEINTPDRTAWANRLAWCQWSIDEMLSGECQEAIGL